MRKIFLALALFAGLTSQALAADNYGATAGSGLIFGAKDAAGVLYSRFIGCDNTTVSQCWAVDASGRLTALAVQSGTWTVQPGNTANTTPWLMSISQGGNTAIVKAGNTFAGTEQAVGVAVTNTLASVTPGDGITTTVYGTAPASPVIGVPLLWNGTTYDRQKSVATGVASVGAASGSFASGSFASGAFAAGSQVDFLTTVGSKSAGTAAASAQLGGLVYNSTPPAPTNGQQTSLQGDTAGNLKVAVQASAIGGCTPGKTLSAASTNATNIKNAAGTLCKLIAINTTATIYYLKTYNTSGTPTCNSDTVVGSYPIPPSNGGVAVNLSTFGEAYTTGISFCLTGGLADNDNTNAATGVAISYSYK